MTKEPHIPSVKKKNKWLSPFSLIRLLGIALFIYILTNVDLKVLWENIKEVDSVYIYYAIGFQVFLLFIKAIRWHILNKGSKKTSEIIQSYGEFFESYAIGVITPGRLGEMVKAGHAKGKNQVMETGIRILVERGIDVGFFIIIAGLASITAYNHLIPESIAYLILAGGIGIFGTAIFLMRSRALTQLAQRVLNSIPFIKHTFQLNFKRLKPSIVLYIFVLSILSNLAAFLSCYMLAIGLDFKLDFLFVSGAVAIAGLINMLPITVMGLGTREGTFLLLFKPMAEPLILAFSGLVFLIAQVGGGLIALVLGQIFLLISKKESKRDK